MVVGFDATTIIDLVGRIGRAVANYSRPDNDEGLDGSLKKLFNTTDTGLRRALTLGVLAGAQETARFGLMAAASNQQTLAPVSSYVREQLLRLSYGYGAFVGPDSNHARPPAVDADVFFGSSLGGRRRKATRPQHVVRLGQLDVGGDSGAGGSDTVDFFAPFSVPLKGDDHFEGGDSIEQLFDLDQPS